MPKMIFNLVFQKQLIPKVHFITFQTENELDFQAGQFFSIEVQPKVFRSYSTVEVSKTPPQFFSDSHSLSTLENGNYVSFMISTKPGGTASNFFETEAKDGIHLEAIGPSGRFQLVQNAQNKVFICTGTGLAPFIPMIKNILADNQEASIQLFFGCWKISDNFVNQFFQEFLNNPKYPNFKIITVAEDLEGQSENEDLKLGRVTTVIPELLADFVTNDFYLCGHPAMVTDMETVLKSKGVLENIHLEKFGSVK